MMVVAYKMYFVPGNNPRTAPMPRKLPKIGYRVWDRLNHTLASNILQFSVIRSLPIPINVEKLDEGGGIAETLMQRKAKLHKSCRNKFSNMKLKRADKRKIQEEPESLNVLNFTRACSGATTSKTEKSCFFCGRSSETLHEASTFVLIAKLSAGDMISQEAVYHAKCLVALYNKADRSKQSKINGNEKRTQGIALAQLVAYIEETRAETKGSAPTVFRLAELTDMYSNSMPQLGVEFLAEFTLLILKKGS